MTVGKPNECPRCGRPYIPEFRVSGTVRVAVVALVAKRPGITLDGIVEVIYADRPNGEPEWAASTIKATIHRANKELLPQGYVIRSKYGQGYRLYSVKHPYPDKHYHGTAGMLEFM